MHVDGYKIAEHKGIVGYTIGQRKGIGIAVGKPLYVTEIDYINNIVYVGPESILYKSKFVVKDLNWLIKKEVKREQIVTAKIRSSAKGAKAKIKMLDDNKMEVSLVSPERAITPGQVCVLYDNQQVLGGGWITENIA